LRALDRKILADVTAKEFARDVGQLANLVGTLRAELGRLSPPSAERGDWSRFLSETGILGADLSKLKRSLQAHDLQTFRKLFKAGALDKVQAKRVARDLGITCLR
jgi:hypothetical protein